MACSCERSISSSSSSSLLLLLLLRLLLELFVAQSYSLNFNNNIPREGRIGTNRVAENRETGSSREVVGRLLAGPLTRDDTVLAHLTDSHDAFNTRY